MDGAKLLSAQNGIEFKEKTVRGEIGYNIIKIAHGKDNFDMIVIGSRGRSSAKEMFFGSVSNYVIHTSKIPVVVVK
jgi:nucleotide-binding universal stress UspA family protein